MGTAVKPYKESEAGKKEQVAEMFNNIAPRYDFLNHFFSLGIDILWRKKAIRKIRPYQPKQVLDIATGTGDFAIAARKLKPDHITGVDISAGMVEVGRKKLQKKGLDQLIKLEIGDSENLPFEDKQFDAITVGFGVRNFENLDKGLAEMHRVLNDKGAVAILEFTNPKAFPVKQLYNFYFRRILPFFGKLISKDKSAYTYLPESVQAFPERQEFMDYMKAAGFSNTRHISLSGGIAAIYLGEK